MSTITTFSQNESDGENEQTYVKRGSRVALIGKAGAGKTTASEIISKAYGHQRLHFAQALKDIATQLWGDSATHNRAALQGLGVFCRSIDPDTWVKILWDQIDSGDQDRPMVVDDCRFPNELEGLLEREFVPIRIEAKESIREDRLMSIGKIESHEQLHHESETALDDVEVKYVLHNNSPERLSFNGQVLGMMKTVIGSE